MLDKNKFKGIVYARGKTLRGVANYLGINAATLYRKLNGESDFYREEIQKLCIYLEIENPSEIFFAEKVT